MYLLEDLNWRYATKKYSVAKVSEEKVGQIVEAINLSASSTGLQPYRLFVIDNDELRQQLGEGSFNQQIANSSHLLVFAAFKNVTAEHIDSYMQLIASQREIPVEALNDFRTGLRNNFLNKTQPENEAWAKRQVYIALGTAMIASAALKVDATPMEGFDQKKFDQLLGLEEKDLSSTVIMSIGYRDEENDPFFNQKKVRLPLDEFLTTIN